MDQSKIAKQLKAITLVIALVGLTIYTFILVSFIKGGEGSTLTASGIVIFSITLIMCCLVLYQFWKVCTQIGCENSFSYENVRAFVAMSTILKILAGIWAGYAIARLFVTDSTSLYESLKPFAFAAVWGIISALAGALAKLIEKARQIREENDLTI